MPDEKDPQLDILGELGATESKPKILIKKDKDLQSAKNINLFSQYFKLILFLVIIIILGVGYLIFLSPLISDYQALSLTFITEQEKNLQQQQEIYDKLTEINKVYQEVSPYLKDKVSNLLPAQPDLPNLYYNLQQLATEANYKLAVFNIHVAKENGQEEVYFIQPGAKTAQTSEPSSVIAPEQIDQVILSQLNNTPKKLKQIGIDLTLSGIGYLNLKNFLDFIEHNLRIIDVTLISYDPTEDKIDLSLVTYYYQ